MSTDGPKRLRPTATNVAILRSLAFRLLLSVLLATMQLACGAEVDQPALGTTRLGAKLGEECDPAQKDACDSGICAKIPNRPTGICCDKPCDGACESCAMAFNGKQDGICSLVLADRPCGGVECVSGRITTDVCTGTSASCDGTRVRYCDSGFDCNGATCRTSCETSAECVNFWVCDNGQCIRPVGLGFPCKKKEECAPGLHCTDGVCCETACSGPCESCLAINSGDPQSADGDCRPVAVGTDPDDDCEAKPPASCGTTGVCDGAGRCAQYGGETACGAAQCVAGRTSGALCNGDGACVPSQEGGCGLFRCLDGTECARTCDDDDDVCIEGAYCDANGVCAGKVPNGAPCGEDDACQSGTCEGGRCCKECGFFSCAADGECKTSCIDSARDCADGFVCNGEALCVAPPDGFEDGATCACRAAGTNRRAPWPLIALLGLALRRRRR